MAKHNGSTHTERNRNVDDLQSFELPRMLSLQDQGIYEETERLSSPSTRNHPPIVHTTKWTSQPAMKRDETRRSFFDLPPKIRMTIYDFYKASLLGDFDLTDKRWPVHLFNFRADYLGRILRAQLVCHQLHTELTPFWTHDMTLLLSYAHFTDGLEHTNSRLVQLKNTWLHVRNLLEWLGPVARYDVRKIRICYMYKFSPSLDWDHHLRILEAETASELLRSFERLTDVHDDLKVEVELRCNGSNGLPFVSTRRVFTFLQRPLGRQNGLDWTHCCGEIESMKINPYFRHLDDVHQRPHFKHCRDEVWQIKQ